MRLTAIAAALGAALLGAGCFEMKQEFRFKADETAEVDIRIAVDAALIAMANENRASDSFCGSANLAKDGVTASAKSTTEGGDFVCLMTMSGPITEVMDAVASAKLDDKAKGGPQQGVSLSREGEVYTLRIELPPPQGSTAEPEDAMAKSIQAMMLAKMSGRSLAWKVSAPRIIETNGKLSEDKTIATYSRPLAEAFTSDTPTTFVVAFTLVPPGLIDRFMGWFE